MDDIPDLRLTNGEIIHAFNKHGMSACIDTLRSFMTSNEMIPPESYHALDKCIEGIIAKYRSLNKSSSRLSGKIKLDDFLQSDVKCPQPKPKSETRYPSFMSLCMPAIVSNAMDIAKNCQSAAKGLAIELEEKDVEYEIVQEKATSALHTQKCLTAELASKEKENRKIQESNQKIRKSMNDVQTQLKSTASVCQSLENKSSYPITSWSTFVPRGSRLTS